MQSAAQYTLSVITAKYTLQSTHSTVHTEQYTLHSTHWTAHTAKYTVHTAPYTMHSTHSTIHTEQHTLQSTHFTVHTAPYTMHSTHCRVHTADYTMHSTHWTETLHSRHSKMHTANILPWWMSDLITSPLPPASSNKCQNLCQKPRPAGEIQWLFVKQNLFYVLIKFHHHWHLRGGWYIFFSTFVLVR